MDYDIFYLRPFSENSFDKDLLLLEELRELGSGEQWTRYLFKSVPYRIVSYPDGRDLKSKPKNTHPDIILLLVEELRVQVDDYQHEYRYE